MKRCRVRCISFIRALHRFASSGSIDTRPVPIWQYMSREFREFNARMFYCGEVGSDRVWKALQL